VVGRHTCATQAHLHLLLLLVLLLQVPLISLTEKLRQRLKSDTWGNYAFWLTFCIIGQPVCLLMYVHDYLFTHGGYRQLSSNIVGQAAAAGAAGEYLRDA
jgi:diacylglycerol O-acyltransferase-1